MTTSKPVPPSTPRPSPPPSGPTGPTPTGPGPGRAAPTNADVLRQFDDALLALAAITHVDPLFRATVPTLAAGDPVTDLRHHLRKALSAARKVAALHTETPARRDVPTHVAPTGGPVPNLPAVSGDGEGAGVRRAIPDAGAGSEPEGFSLPQPPPLVFTPGAERVYGRVGPGPSIGRLYSA